MLIGCNWSEELGKLLESGRVRVDYIKTGAFGRFEELFPRLRRLRPILLHGLGCNEHTGMPDAEKIDLGRARRWIEACGSPHYGLHLAVCYRDLTPDMQREDIFRRMADTVTLFKESIGVPLLLENVPDTPQERAEFDHYPFADPQEVSRVVVENGVQLLLDLSHAKTTAQYHGVAPLDYIRALPLDRVGEIHVNGSGFDGDGNPVDDHEAMKAEDFELLAAVLEEAHPRIVTLEYDGLPGEPGETVRDSLICQLEKLEKLVYQL